MWPITSVSASSTTSLSIRPEPGIEGPPVWIVLWMPYLRAHPTILRAVGPSLTPRRPVTGDGMNMAVDQAGRYRRAIGIDDGGGAFGIDVFGAADRRDPAVDGQNRVGIQNRLLEGPREHQPDITDHEFGRPGCLGFVVGHRFSLFVQCLRKAAGRAS